MDTRRELENRLENVRLTHFWYRNWVVAIVRFAWAVEDLTAADRTWLAARTFLWR